MSGPDLIVLDEPTSSLDQSIRSRIISLLKDIQETNAVSYLFISHDLSTVRKIAHRVAVMYLGRIVEVADRSTIYETPKHPYTRALLRAAPHPQPQRLRQRASLIGEVPSPINPPSGCAFHPRCDLARDLATKSDAADTVSITVAGKPTRVMKRCHAETPALTALNGNAHTCACHFAAEG